MNVILKQFSFRKKIVIQNCWCKIDKTKANRPMGLNDRPNNDV